MEEMKRLLDGLPWKNMDDMERDVDPLRAAKLYVSLSSSVIGMMSMYYSCHGIDPDSTTLGKEKGRLEMMKRKLDKVEAKRKIGGRKRLELNIEAASRFIAAAQPHLSKSEKDMLVSKAKETKVDWGKKKTKRGEEQMKKKTEKKEGQKKKKKKKTEEEETKGRGPGGDTQQRKQTRRDSAMQFLDDAMSDITGGTSALTASTKPAKKNDKET